MALSSNSFFHFTSDMRFLCDILANGFWPRYCKEYGWGKKYVEFTLPMVCFCDIPLTQVHSHTDFYGGYGIGVSRTWVTQNKSMNPVHYINVQSSEGDYIRRLLTKLKNNELNDDGYRKLSLIKKVSGIVFNKQNEMISKKLYDEREWRYIPDFEPINTLLKKWDQEYNVNTLSESTDKNRISIASKDIKHIIIPNEALRTNMINQIRIIYKDNPRNQEMVISRIQSLQQIKNDF